MWIWWRWWGETRAGSLPWNSFSCIGTFKENCKVCLMFFFLAYGLYMYISIVMVDWLFSDLLNKFYFKTSDDFIGGPYFGEFFFAIDVARCLSSLFVAESPNSFFIYLFHIAKIMSRYMLFPTNFLRRKVQTWYGQFFWQYPLNNENFCLQCVYFKSPTIIMISHASIFSHISGRKV